MKSFEFRTFSLNAGLHRMAKTKPSYCGDRGSNGGGQTGGRNSVKYIFEVLFDDYPGETSITLRNRKNNRVITRRKYGARPFEFYRKEIKLVPGGRYVLNLRDFYGNGMEFGYVHIYAFVRGIPQTLVVDLGDFRRRRNRRFRVPRNIGQSTPELLGPFEP